MRPLADRPGQSTSPHAAERFRSHRACAPFAQDHPGSPPRRPPPVSYSIMHSRPDISTLNFIISTSVAETRNRLVAASSSCRSSSRLGSPLQSLRRDCTGARRAVGLTGQTRQQHERHVMPWGKAPQVSRIATSLSVLAAVMTKPDPCRLLRLRVGDRSPARGEETVRAAELGQVKEDGRVCTLAASIRSARSFRLPNVRLVRPRPRSRAVGRAGQFPMAGPQQRDRGGCGTRETGDRAQSGGVARA